MSVDTVIEQYISCPPNQVNNKLTMSTFTYFCSKLNCGGGRGIAQNFITLWKN